MLPGRDGQTGRNAIRYDTIVCLTCSKKLTGINISISISRVSDTRPTPDKNIINFSKRIIADTLKDGLLLGGGIQHRRSSRAEVNKFLFAYVMLFKRVYFRQYFVYLSKKIFNCCNVLLSLPQGSRLGSCILFTSSSSHTPI